MKLFRCSQLAKLIGTPKAKGEVLTQSAKKAIRDIVKYDLFGYIAFKGNKSTQKGVELEEQAIGLLSDYDFCSYTKHTGRVSNNLITGECDILTDDTVIDIKCAWDIGSHPFFDDEAAEKSKEMGYDVQVQAYMWLYDKPRAQLAYVLLPCPEHLIGIYGDREQLIEMVEVIPAWKRIKTVSYERDDAVIERIKTVIPHCQQYYAECMAQYE